MSVKELQDQMERFRESDDSVFVATVTGVNEDDATIQIIDQYRIEYTDVRLNSIVKEGGAVTVFPAEGSDVLIGMIKENELFVLQTHELLKIKGVIGTTVFEIDKDGYQVNREGENLLNVMENFLGEFGKLCDELNKVQVSVGVTPNVVAITAIKQKVTNDIKELFKTILK